MFSEITYFQLSRSALAALSTVKEVQLVRFYIWQATVFYHLDFFLWKIMFTAAWRVINERQRLDVFADWFLLLNPKQQSYGSYPTENLRIKRWTCFFVFSYEFSHFWEEQGLNCASHFHSALPRCPKKLINMTHTCKSFAISCQNVRISWKQFSLTCTESQPGSSLVVRCIFLTVALSKAS